MKTLTIIALFAVLLNTISAEENSKEYWYSITVREQRKGMEGNIRYYGSMDINATEVANVLQTKGPLTLKNLVWWDKDGTAKKWSDWDPNNTDVLIIPYESIVLVLPLKDKPIGKREKVTVDVMP